RIAAHSQAPGQFIHGLRGIPEGLARWVLEFADVILLELLSSLIRAKTENLGCLIKGIGVHHGFAASPPGVSAERHQLWVPCATGRRRQSGGLPKVTTLPSSIVNPYSLNASEFATKRIWEKERRPERGRGQRTKRGLCRIYRGFTAVEAC